MADLKNSLNATEISYNGETFKLGSEEARIIYTALKELSRNGRAVSDGYFISSSAPASSATSGQLFVTSSAMFKETVGADVVAGFDVVCIKR